MSAIVRPWTSGNVRRAVLPGALAGLIAIAGCTAVSPPAGPVDTSAKAPTAGGSPTPAVAPAPAAATRTPGSGATKPPATNRSGAFYLDDGPGDLPPAELATLPDPEPRQEPLHRFANRPYSVFGQDFTPEQSLIPFRQRGTASWYGKRFHGARTAIGETYDMYQLTAAHPTLALPSYARVTNVANGRQVIVRINDRGPFLHGRVIDLSYAAASRLGYVAQGSATVEIESITPERMDQLAESGTPAPVGGPARMLEPRGEQHGFPLFNERDGVFIQLGAFAVRDNAESLRARLALEWSSLVQSAQLVMRQGLHRIWLGPYRSPLEARSAAERIAQQIR